MGHDGIRPLPHRRGTASIFFRRSVSVVRADARVRRGRLVEPPVAAARPIVGRAVSVGAARRGRRCRSPRPRSRSSDRSPPTPFPAATTSAPISPTPICSIRHSGRDNFRCGGSKASATGTDSRSSTSTRSVSITSSTPCVHLFVADAVAGAQGGARAPVGSRWPVHVHALQIALVRSADFLPRSSSSTSLICSSISTFAPHVSRVLPH